MKSKNNNKNESAKLYEGYVICGEYRFSFSDLANPYGYLESLRDKCRYFGCSYDLLDEEIKCFNIAKGVYDKEMTRREWMYEDYQLELFPYIKRELEVDDIDKINSFVSLCSSESLAKCFRRAVSKYKFYKSNICFLRLSISISLVDDAFSSVILEMSCRRKGVSDDDFASYINGFIDEAFSKFSKVDKLVDRREAIRLSGSGGEYITDCGKLTFGRARFNR